jgi:hypothetical protein
VEQKGNQIQIITYYRTPKPPTLKQFVHRKFVHQVMEQVKGENGTTEDPVTRRTAPVSAVKARDLMKGKKAEELIAEHPDWVEEYKREYPDGAGDKKT